MIFPHSAWNLWRIGFAVFLCAAGALALNPCAAAPALKLTSVIQDLERAAAAEIHAGHMSGVSISLVVSQEVVYTGGFGWADKKRGVKAGADTVYRAGSISKLFTALAAMTLVDEGKLDIDRPVMDYNPSFSTIDPFTNAVPITLRQLMCHRAGLVRESPVGGYFDDKEPDLDASVASLGGCVLVYPPGTATKYSNIGVAVVGQTVARVSGEPFARYQEARFFKPLGMTRSSFVLNGVVKTTLAKGYMWVPDAKGVTFHETEAPLFELGTIPAGNLYSTVSDLGRFLAFLFSQGRMGAEQVVQARTLEAMFTPQLTKEKSGFGLGFHVGEYKGRKKISHTGAVYGFTSAMTGLPSEQLGVVVLCNDDLATGPVMKLNNLALDLLLEAASGGRTPKKPAGEGDGLSPADLAGMQGEYESESYWARIEAAGGKLKAIVSGQPIELRPAAEENRFIGDGRFVFESPFVFQSGAPSQGFTALGQTFRRVDTAPREAPEIWKKYVGSYGPPFIPLIISIRHGHLYAMTENMFDYRLTPVNLTVYAMPPGLYTGEAIVFQPDKSGRAQAAVLANMSLPRRGR